MLTYKPPATVRRMMLNSAALARFIIGPVGSGKTTGCIFELFRRACQQAPNADRVRPTRFVIVRNTLQQLRTSVLKDIQEIFGELAEWKVSESTIHFKFPCADGTTVKSEWMLIPLETVEDVRRLLSLQLTGIFIEEFREVNFDLVASMLGRVGRYPSTKLAGVEPTWQGLIASSNPFPEGSKWHETLVLNLPDGWDFYQQPSGLSDEAENVENLPSGYYQRLMEGTSEEFQKVFVHGQYGEDMSGQTVFGKVFSWTTHTRDYLPIDPNSTCIIGADTDRNPAMIIGQRSMTGQLKVLREIFSEGVGLETFVREQVIPILTEMRVGSCYIVADPSCVKRDSISEESQKMAFQRLGFDVVLAPTNDLPPRLAALDSLFSSMVGGSPAVLISREGCPNLIRALRAEYKYARIKAGNAAGELAPKPSKLHPWSDLVDALGYLALGQSANRLGFSLRPPHARGAGGQPKFTAAAWT